MNFAGKEYPTVDTIALYNPNTGSFMFHLPVIAIPIMCDERWRELSEGKEAANA